MATPALPERAANALTLNMRRSPPTTIGTRAENFCCSDSARARSSRSAVSRMLRLRSIASVDGGGICRGCIGGIGEQHASRRGAAPRSATAMRWRSCAGRRSLRTACCSAVSFPRARAAGRRFRAGAGSPDRRSRGRLLQRYARTASSGARQSFRRRCAGSSPRDRAAATVPARARCRTPVRGLAARRAPAAARRRLRCRRDRCPQARQ